MEHTSPDEMKIPCPYCGQAFNCGIRAGNTTCWCFDLPQVMPVPSEIEQATLGCLCPLCLRKEIANRLKKQD